MTEYVDDARAPGDPVARGNGLLPVVVLASLGVLLEAVVLWNFVTEISTLSVQFPPVLAAGLGTALAGGIVYSSYWQFRTGIDTATRWRITGGAVLGSTAFLAVFGVTIAVRLLEGRTIAEPQFALYTAAGAGGVAGILVGLFYARARRDADQARQARAETEAALADVRRTRDRIELVNSVLRHDIANDIMIIRARADAIADRAGEELAAFAEVITAQVDDIESQLDRTRAILEAVTTGDERSLQPLSLSTALADQAATLREAHPDMEVALDVPDDVSVLADDLLPDVLGNVLGNAVTHNDQDHPHVDVTVDRTDEEVICRIADNGPGIPDEEKRAVLAEGHSEREGGHGFGLFFVGTMLEAYGGSVRIEDANPRGAVFVLTFQRE
jgi:signal transduction histidine kinase